MDLTLVSHTHWDREWYRSFEGFRARLVDTIDRVLDLVDDDPGFRFLLDGQTIVLEDYLEIRPAQRERLVAACASGRISIGPWYVQPDSLLPGGETHIRNLLEGRRTGEPFGGVSQVAYTPDSFGHPARFPQLFSGFGLGPFVYWRGNGSEIDELPAEYAWVAPDGSEIAVHHLGEGYFGACGLPEEPMAAASFLQELALGLARRSRGDAVLLMNGIDHAAPDDRVPEKLDALQRATGWSVRRGLLEDFAARMPTELPRFEGELVGGRIANLLPGVWSARMPIKQRNRRVETLLHQWLEPLVALAPSLGLADERASLRKARRLFLANQAHDTLGGCSTDRVHRQAEARYDGAEELANETVDRLLERIAGAPLVRRTPWSDAVDVAVFNPGPQPRTDRVRLPLTSEPWLEYRGEFDRSVQVHPLLGASENAAGFLVDGVPARLVAGAEDGIRLAPAISPKAVEFVAHEVPAFGWRRYRIEPAPACPDQRDSGTALAGGGFALEAAPDGTFTLAAEGRQWSGLGAIEDLGDRGDSYDHDPLGGGILRPETVEIERARHPGGISSLQSTRTFLVPARLAGGRDARADSTLRLRVVMRAVVVEGTGRVDLECSVEDPACDHRLRILFPTGHDTTACRAASTFEVRARAAARAAEPSWVHPPPRTFCHQGWVEAGGLVVVAPGLPEAELCRDGSIAITLLRKVGWLARTDLASRPEPAGPMIATPAAQEPRHLVANLALLVAADEAAAGAAAAEAGLRAVVAGPEPRLSPGNSLMTLEPHDLVLAACKPAEDGAGVVVRVQNPGDQPRQARLSASWGVRSAQRVRLDETPLDDGALTVFGGTLDFEVGGASMVTLRLE